MDTYSEWWPYSIADIHTHPNTTLIFLNKQDWSTPEGSTRADESFIKKFLDLSLYFLNSTGTMQFGVAEMGRTLGSKSMHKSISLSVGILG